MKRREFLKAGGVGLAALLAGRMLEATPGAYAGQKIDFYIQRFRRSWTHHHTFVRERGWRAIARAERASAPADIRRHAAEALGLARRLGDAFRARGLELESLFTRRDLPV